MDGCPNCGGDNYHYVSGWQNGEPIEPGEDNCDDCGFHYVEHCKNPMRNQVARFRSRIRKSKARNPK